MIRPVFRYPYDIYVGQQAEITQNTEWLPMPNPTNGKVRLSGHVDPSASWAMMDLQGRVLASGNLDSNLQIDLSAFPAGMYFIGIEAKRYSGKYMWKKVIRSEQ